MEDPKNIDFAINIDKFKKNCPQNNQEIFFIFIQNKFVEVSEYRHILEFFYK